MEVNKAASWEDVLANNFSPEAQEQKQETTDTQETVATEEQGVEGTQTSEETTVDNSEAEQVTTTVETELDTTEQEDESDSHQETETVTASDNFEFDNLNEDELYELLTLKKTDYNEISDVDIVAGLISSEHENWSDEDIAFELEQKYGSALFEDKIDLDEIDRDVDPEAYKEAVKHNKEVDRAQKLLRRDALEIRAELEEYKSNIQLPTSKVKTVEDNVNTQDSAEVDSDGPTPEEVAEHNERWAKLVESEVPNVKEFTFKLGDEDVSYKVTDEEQAQLVERMKDFNAELYFANRGWVKSDGSLDVKKITEDVYILENSEKMFKSGWTQAKEKAKMDIIGKDIKNINLSSPDKTFDAKGGDPHDFGNFVLSL